MSTQTETALSEHIGVDVTPELKQRVRVAAAKEGQNMSEFVRELLESSVPAE